MGKERKINMRLDLKRHKLLEILSDPDIRIESGESKDVKYIGMTYEEIMGKMNCNRHKLSIIASELYRNDEIHHYDVDDIEGICCYKNGLASFSNGKYRSRYWQDVRSISLTIIPILSLVVATIAVSHSRESSSQKEEMLLLRKQLERHQVILDSLTIEKQNYHVTTLEIDSLPKNLK